MGNGRLPLRIIRCLDDCGVDFILLSKDRHNVSRKSKYCREFIHSDPQNDEALVDQLLTLKRAPLPEILFPITTPGFQFAARNQDRLGDRFRIPPISAIESLEIASDKRRLYEFSLRNEFPVLPSVTLEENPSYGEQSLPFPALAKTTNREFGAGFKRINSSDELDSFRDSLDQKQRSEYIIQPFITGKDVSFSAYCEDGKIKCYTVWRAIFYGKKKYEIPRCIEFMDNPRALALAGKLLGALRWEGVCDIDFFEDDKSGDLWLLEVNARLWGNVVGCTLRGINFPRLLCDAALGKPSHAHLKQSGGIYCYPKGIPRALKRTQTRKALLHRPFVTTGLMPVIKDIGPEFYKFYLKAKLPLTRRFNRSPSNSKASS